MENITQFDEKIKSNLYKIYTVTRSQQSWYKTRSSSLPNYTDIKSLFTLK